MKKANRLFVLCVILLVALAVSACASIRAPVTDFFTEPVTDPVTDPAVTPPEIREVQVPILLYHHITADLPESGVTVKPETFRRHMELLKKNGYTTVSFEEVISFANGEGTLPEKCVVITFDDGYYSNYEIAYPILRELGMKATIFVIGDFVGDTEYKDTGVNITPHFGENEINEMVKSGVISVQSHSYDMHQSEQLDESEWVRDAVYKLAYETDEDFALAIKTDAQTQAALFRSLNIPEPCVFAYPKGISSPESDATLLSFGYLVTLTTNGNRVNTVIWG